MTYYWHSNKLHDTLFCMCKSNIHKCTVVKYDVPKFHNIRTGNSHSPRCTVDFITWVDFDFHAPFCSWILTLVTTVSVAYVLGRVRYIINRLYTRPAVCISSVCEIMMDFVSYFLEIAQH